MTQGYDTGSLQYMTQIMKQVFFAIYDTGYDTDSLQYMTQGMTQVFFAIYDTGYDTGSLQYMTQGYDTKRYCDRGNYKENGAKPS